MYIEGLNTKDGVNAAWEYLNKRVIHKKEKGWIIACGIIFCLGILCGAFIVTI